MKRLSFLDVRSPLCGPGISRCLQVLLAVALLAFAGRSPAEEPDDTYLRLFAITQEADSLKAEGKAEAALAKYKKVQTGLGQIQRNNRDWNAKMVAYRISYVADQIAELTKKDTAPAPEQQPAKAGAAKTELQVRLIEPGAEPRKTLRLNPKAGDKQAVAMTVTLSMATRVGEAEAPAVKLPAMTMALEAKINSVSPDGDIAWEMVMGDCSMGDEPGAVPQLAEMMKAAFANLKGLAIPGTTSSRGFTKVGETKPPAGADAQTRQIMDQISDSFARMTQALPEEPVGAGAKWEAKGPVKSQGVSLILTTTSQLVSLEGDTIAVRTALTQSAPAQKIQNPAMPAMKLELTKLTGNGSGQLKHDLGKLLPSQASGDTHTEMSMAMSSGGQKQAMTVTTDANVKMEAK